MFVCQNDEFKDSLKITEIKINKTLKNYKNKLLEKVEFKLKDLVNPEVSLNF